MKSNSLRMLDGLAQSTLNPLGGTQNSNIMHMNPDGGGVLFITDQDGQAIGNSSITKINEIAYQLGQSYLVKDLACLVVQ